MELILKIAIYLLLSFTYVGVGWIIGGIVFKRYMAKWTYFGSNTIEFLWSMSWIDRVIYSVAWPLIIVVALASKLRIRKR